MIHLDAATGVVTWGEYTIQRKLTHDEFIKGKFDFIIAEDHEVQIVYQLPPQLLVDQLCILQIAYFDFSPYISHIHIDRAEINYDDKEQWCREECHWIDIARAAIYSDLGEPHRVERPTRLYDKIPCAIDRTSQFQNWTYRFPWGEAGLSYVDDDVTNRIWLSYGLA